MLSPFAARVVIANPLLVRAIAHAHVKTDKIDAGTRASLHAAGLSAADLDARFGDGAPAWCEIVYGSIPLAPAREKYLGATGKIRSAISISDTTANAPRGALRSKTLTPEEIEADADATARWEEAVGWTAPEEGIPGAGIPPFPLDGAADEWFLKLIDESPDVRATRVSMGNAWLQIYSGSHPECGTFTVLIEEHKYVRGAIEEAYVVSNGTLMCDNINFWYEGSLRAQQM